MTASFISSTSTKNPKLRWKCTGLGVGISGYKPGSPIFGCQTSDKAPRQRRWCSQVVKSLKPGDANPASPSAGCVSAVLGSSLPQHSLRHNGATSLKCYDSGVFQLCSILLSHGDLYCDIFIVLYTEDKQERVHSFDPKAQWLHNHILRKWDKDTTL